MRLVLTLCALAATATVAHASRSGTRRASDLLKDIEGKKGSLQRMSRAELKDACAKEKVMWLFAAYDCENPSQRLHFAMKSGCDAGTLRETLEDGADPFHGMVYVKSASKWTPVDLALYTDTPTLFEAIADLGLENVVAEGKKGAFAENAALTTDFIVNHAEKGAVNAIRALAEVVDIGPLVTADALKHANGAPLKSVKVVVDFAMARGKEKRIEAFKVLVDHAPSDVLTEAIADKAAYPSELVTHMELVLQKRDNEKLTQAAAAKAKKEAEEAKKKAEEAKKGKDAAKTQDNTKAATADAKVDKKADSASGGKTVWIVLGIVSLLVVAALGVAGWYYYGRRSG